MKRNTFSGLFILLLLALVACGGEPTPESEALAPTSESVAPLPPTEIPVQPTLPPPVISQDGAVTTDTGTTAGEAVPTPIPTPVGPWPTDQFGYGIQIHGNATVGDPIQTMTAVSEQLGLQWVKVQVQWWLVHPEPTVEQWFFYDAVIEQAKLHNLRVMVSIVGAPAWTRAAGGENGPPDDYTLYANFLVEMLNRHPNQIDAIEVWNEQNLDREWTTGRGISPEDYVAFLKVAYEAVKAADPDVIIISGALAPTGTGDWVRWADDFEYLDRALTAGLLNYADCVGAHHNGYNIGPDVTFDQAGQTAEAGTAIFRGPFDNPHHSWSFKTTLDTYAAKVQAIDPNKKLCVTEFGWASSEGYAEYPTGFEFVQDNTLAEQATYIVQAYQQMRNSGDVWLAFLFNFDFGNKGSGPTDDPVPYSIIDAQGIPRPAFGAISEMPKQ